MTDAYSGSERLASAAGEYNAMDFIVRQIAGGMMTSTLVMVKAVGSGTVDVQPMVNQIDGLGNAMPHGTVHGLPVWRLQGGNGAVILTPAVGDIGVALFSREDISSVKVNRAPSNPGSRRRYAYADGIYMGGVLNVDPIRYVEIGPNGTTVVDPVSVTITTPRVTMSQDLMVTGDIMTGPGSTFNGKSFDSHEHSGVQTGSGTSGPPV